MPKMSLLLVVGLVRQKLPRGKVACLAGTQVKILYHVQTHSRQGRLAGTIKGKLTKAKQRSQYGVQFGIGLSSRILTSGESLLHLAASLHADYIP